jgi:hypothetical protein
MRCAGLSQVRGNGGANAVAFGSPDYEKGLEKL